jgi:putative peptidoglycan lipid II flippase
MINGMASENAHSLIKNYLIVIVLTLVSNVLGFIKEILTAKFFGISSEVDIYVVAFSFISIFVLIFSAGPFQGAFIPLFTRHYYQDKNEGWDFFSKVLNLIGIMNIAIIIAIIIVLIYRPELLRFIVPGFNDAQLINLNAYIKILLILILLSSISVLFISILQVFGNFLLSVSPPILNNIVIILTIILLYKSLGICSLIFGIALGSIFSFLWLVFSVFRYRPVYSIRVIKLDSQIKDFVLFAFPMVLLIFIDQINALIQKTIVSVTGSGNISALNYAYKLVGIPVGLFGMGIATVIFPALASLINKRKEHGLLNEKVINGLNFLIYTLVPTTIFFMAFATPIVRLMFERGAFTYEASIRTSYPLKFYSVGILGQALIVYLHRIFFAFGDSKLPLKIGMISAVFHLLFCILFVGYFDYVGIAIATTVYAYLYFIMLLIFLFKKHLRIELSPALTLFFKIILLSVVSMFVSFFLFRGIASSKFMVIANLSVYGIVFFILSYIFRIKETRLIFQTVGSYLKRGK